MNSDFSLLDWKKIRVIFVISKKRVSVLKPGWLQLSVVDFKSPVVLIVWTLPVTFSYYSYHPNRATLNTGAN